MGFTIGFNFLWVSSMKNKFSVQFECGLLLLIVMFMGLIEISKFCLDMTNLEGKRALNCSRVLAGANFIALRRASW